VTLVRHPGGPILTRADVPPIPPHVLDPSSVFNPGAARTEDGGVLLLLRVQTRGRRTFLVPARSADGVRFAVSAGVSRLSGMERLGERVHHVYDPRITRIEDRWLVLAAADTDGGCRAALFETEDFRTLELVSCDTARDLRNAVLFPERVGGRYLRLERPNRSVGSGEPPSGDEIVLSESADLVSWRPVATVLRGRPRYWDERIGSGPPPLKTREGWLHVYHGVATHFASVSVYQAGAVLLDLDAPEQVLARTRDNVLEPREPWELTGQVPNVVFPTGLVAREEDTDGFALPESPLLLYYGAADTCVGLATTTVRELIDACRA
jgi:beta-1,4-mannooligosaccharide/beta-1,4-mannosyl-N-acetylglucosamine phosphorylase